MEFCCGVSAMEKELMAPGEFGIPRVATILSYLLKGTADQNDERDAALPCHFKRESMEAAGLAFSGFDMDEIPIERYLHHIFLNTDCSPSCFVVAFVYLDRFLHLYPTVQIRSYNVHRFAVTAILTAVKFFDQRCYGNNAHFANIGKISLSEMNSLEMNFVFGMNFKLEVPSATYKAYCSFLHGQMRSLPADSQRCPKVCDTKKFLQPLRPCHLSS